MSRKLPPFRWQRVNDEPFEYGIVQDIVGDEFVKLKDGSYLRRSVVPDYSLEWDKSEPQRVFDVIKEIGIHRLANLDGCICSSFEIRNVEINISCGKGGDRGCWISSRSIDYPESEVELAKVLGDVGAEVLRQIDNLHDGRGPMPLHYCEHSKAEKEDRKSISTS